MKNNIKFGDICLVQFDGVEHEISGCRPALVVSNNIGNMYSPNVQVIPMSSSLTKSKLPTHVFIAPNEENGLTKPTIAQCESQRVRSKSCFIKKIGTLSDSDMRRIAVAVNVSTPLAAYLPTNLFQKKALALQK